MRRLLVLLISVAFVAVDLSGQTHKNLQRSKKRTSTVRVVRKKTVNKRKEPSVKSLQSERQRIQRTIKEQERKLKSNERDVKQRLQNLLIINNEIVDRKRSIDTIRNDISLINNNITALKGQLKKLSAELADRKQKYMKSLRYMHRNRSVQNQLMFIFSADNFTQMYRRIRFMREYAAYQRAQGELVKSKQNEITQKHAELTNTKRQKNVLLYKGEQEHRKLEGSKAEQQQVVNTLQKQQKTIESIIAQQRKRSAELNAQIDRLIAQEVARAKARAAAEAKRKAEAEAARKRAEELRKKKEEAARIARENKRKIEAAKAEEARLKALARAAERKNAAEKREAEAAAKKAEESRIKIESKAAAEEREHKREVAKAQKSADEGYSVSSEDRRISGGFENNRGRLPMPITGVYKIVTRFGQYNVEGLRNVVLDNKGINIKGQAGAHARSIFDGEVSYVFSYGGTYVVMVRHGSYISVYCNLAGVSVSRGQHVSARQSLGTVGPENILQFQLYHERNKLNPEAWLGR